MTGGIQKSDIHLRMASREMARSARRCHVRGSDPPHPWWGTMVTHNGSKSVVEVAPISYPSGKCNFNVFPGSYPYPYLLPGIRIFRISRESHRVATRSHRLQLRAVEDVTTSNLSLGTSR